MANHYFYGRDLHKLVIFVPLLGSISPFFSGQIEEWLLGGGGQIMISPAEKKGTLAVILTTRMALLLGTNWFVLTVLKRTRHISQQTEAAQPFFSKGIWLKMFTIGIKAKVDSLNCFLLEY